MSDSKKAILNEEVGPTIKYGKHSSYYRKGKNKIIVSTKKNDEELPPGISLTYTVRKVIYEDSRGNTMICFEFYEPKPWKPTHGGYSGEGW